MQAERSRSSADEAVSGIEKEQRESRVSKYNGAPDGQLW